MKTYKSHKTVHAAKIAAAERNEDGSLTVATEDGDLFHVDNLSATKFAGMGEDELGYYVEYIDGYVSWSPTKAFEDGYTAIDEAGQ